MSNFPIRVGLTASREICIADNIGEGIKIGLSHTFFFKNMV